MLLLACVSAEQFLEKMQDCDNHGDTPDVVGPWRLTYPLNSGYVVGFCSASFK